MTNTRWIQFAYSIVDSDVSPVCQGDLRTNVVMIVTHYKFISH
jgi:hypothetical protein